MSHEQQDQESASAATTSSNASHWLDDSIAFLTADLDLDFDGYGWLPTTATQEQHRSGVVAGTVPPPDVLPRGPDHVSSSVASSPVTSPREFGQPEICKSPEQTAPGHSSQRRQVGGGRDGAEQDKGGASYGRKPSKKGGAKGGAASLDRDARWAEQLLNQCAAAIETGNLARVQHLFYVLGELASFSSSEANHRLAAYGLRALALRLTAAVGQAAVSSIKIPACECPTAAFSGIEPRLFRASLIKFHEVSPWFALPNALANAAIAHAATRGAATAPRHLHVVDLGASHGVQWPTLLDALTRVPRGSTQPTVRLTVVGSTAMPPVPFSASPPGYDFSPQLLRYAKSINLELAIDRVTSLDALHGIMTSGEALVICLQFRLGHVTADEQAVVLQKVINLNPELVVLAELDGGCRHHDGSLASEFAARLELLWRFLESTAVAFKGRDADERLVMEAEAGTALAAAQWGAVLDGREGWGERMTAAGFEEKVFGGEAVETAKALLRKYEGGWEMVAPSPPPAGGAVGLRWKGQPVSFCSLWRPA